MKYLLSLFLTFLTFFIYGYTYGTDPNLNQILPFINKINNPLLYPNDPYIQTLSSFPSFYPYLIAYLARIIPLPILHITLYLILKYLLFLIVFNLSQYLFSHAKTSILASFLFALSPLANTFTLLGDDPLMKTVLYQTSFVGPFALLTIFLFIQRKYIASFFILGLLYYFNGMTATFILIMFIFAGFNAHRSILKGWLILAIFLLPWLIWYLRLPNINGKASEMFIPILKMWYPGHYFPSTWSLSKWINLTIFLIYFSIFFKYGFKNSKAAMEIKAFILSMLTMWSIASVFGEFIPVYQIILIQFFRSDVFFISLGLIFAADYIRRMIETRTLINISLSGLVLIAFIEFSEPRYALPALALFLLSLSPYKIAFKALIIGSLALCVLNIFYFPIAMKKNLIASLFITMLLVMRPKDEIPSSVKIASLYLIILFLIILPYLSIIPYRIAAKDMASKTPLSQDWEELQNWVRTHTPTKSVFIVPPYRNGFRVFSQRSSLVEWIDASAMHWSPGFEREWIKRLRDLGFSKKFSISSLVLGNVEKNMPSRTENIYNNIAEKEIIQLSKNYGSDYIIRENESMLKFPLIYQNKSFYLYEIPKEND